MEEKGEGKEKRRTSEGARREGRRWWIVRGDCGLFMHQEQGLKHFYYRKYWYQNWSLSKKCKFSFYYNWTVMDEVCTFNKNIDIKIEVYLKNVNFPFIIIER